MDPEAPGLPEQEHPEPEIEEPGIDRDLVLLAELEAEHQELLVALTAVDAGATGPDDPER